MMRKWFTVLTISAVVGLSGLMVGCEWTGSGEDGSFNTALYGWVNFSGVYRAAAGGLLVTDFSVGAGGSGTGSVVTVTAEAIGTGNGANTTFSGTLNNTAIVPGSVSITAGAATLVDDGAGALSGNNSSGAIDYGTGGWSIDLQGAPLTAGVVITATYNYTASASSGSGGSGAGSSGGATIYSFTVFQTGNKLQFTDNQGATYTGQFGQIRTTGSIDASTSGGIQPSAGDSVIGEFTVEGLSPAGVSTMIVGTFQGVVAGSGQSEANLALFLTDRRVQGSWIESSGTTGDVNGLSSPVTITTP